MNITHLAGIPKAQKSMMQQVQKTPVATLQVLGELRDKKQLIATSPTAAVGDEELEIQLVFGSGIRAYEAQGANCSVLSVKASTLHLIRRKLTINADRLAAILSAA